MSRIDAVHWKELSPLLDEVLELAGEARLRWLEALRLTRPQTAAELQLLLAELHRLDEAGFLQIDPATMHGLREILRRLAGP
jgi:hypothetical protein